LVCVVFGCVIVIGFIGISSVISVIYRGSVLSCRILVLGIGLEDQEWMLQCSASSLVHSRGVWGVGSTVVLS